MIGGRSLGALAAFTSSATWAFGSTRYALASREVSPIRVNLVRMLCAWPVFIGIGLLSGDLGSGLTPTRLGWLACSTLCSYAVADNLFFAAARRIGVSSALAIASTYPLWAALEGTAVEREPFGWARAFGTLLCVGGVSAIIKLRPTARDDGELPRDRIGVPLALVTSLLWAGNTIAIKAGATGLPIYTVNGVRYGIAMLILAGMVLGGRAPGPKRPHDGWLPMMPAIAADCVLGTSVFIYGLTHTDLAIGATLSSLAPLLALPFAVWMGGEKLSLGRLAAITVTVIGIVLLAAS